MVGNTPHCEFYIVCLQGMMTQLQQAALSFMLFLPLMFHESAESSERISFELNVRILRIVVGSLNTRLCIIKAVFRTLQSMRNADSEHAIDNMSHLLA